MKQWHHDQGCVVGRKRVCVFDVFDGLHQIQVSERDAFGTAGSTRSVEKQRDVGIGGGVGVNH